MRDTSTPSDVVEESSSVLHRGSQNRHIQLIVLDGIIDTGLSLDIGPVIQMAGPTVLLGYAAAGIVAFLIMRQLDEMVAEEPVSGSLTHFTYKYWGPFTSFLSGWNYWVMFVLVGMAELTVVGIYMQYWLPDVLTWVWAAAFFLIINAVNLVNVRLYSEAELWFALIKVLTITDTIVFGLRMLFGGHGSSKARSDNLWKHGGLLAAGWHGLILSLAAITFPFGGLELTGTIAAEMQNPGKSTPKVVDQVTYRILLFYIGSLVVLLAFYPWVEIKSDSSPFMMIFHHLDSSLVAFALDFVILVTSLSAYNSGVHSNNRILFGLSVQGNTPTFLARVSKRGVPMSSLLLSGITTSLAVVLNCLLSYKALGLLMALVVATLFLNWTMICMAYLKFRATQRRKRREPEFKMLLMLASNHFCIALLGPTLVLMCTTDGMHLSVIPLSVWILFLFIAFKLLRRPA